MFRHLLGDEDSVRCRWRALADADAAMFRKGGIDNRAVCKA
jgi:hypothetical protein